MKTKINIHLTYFITLSLLLFGKPPLHSQSIVPQINSDPVYLTEEVFIAGGCFDVTNAVVSGGFGAVGTFSNGSTSIGIETGIVLSTGSVLNISGPNTQTNYTTNFNNLNPDPDLELIIDNPVIPIQDVAILEFDFTPTSSQVIFEYVFASEEYCDFVNTLYNDVFGFFISGPGINGAFTDNAENIALIPGTADFVAINNINHLTNSSFYIDNIPLDDPQVSSCPGGYPNSNGIAVEGIEFDGFTQVMTASATVIPCETYHIKLVVGDVTDGQYDSAVFLKANSFEAGETVVVDALSPATNSNVVYEGCNDAYFLFQRFGADLNNTLIIDFTISNASTAEGGPDYDFLPSSITFEAGVESVQIPVQIFSDGVQEGSETLILELESACSCFTTFTEFIIEDADAMTGFLEDFMLCGSEPVTLVPVIENGLMPYEYHWSNGSDAPEITVTPNSSEIYFLTVTDACGSMLELDSEIFFSPQQVAVLSGNIQICVDESAGALPIEILGEGPWSLIYNINGETQEALIIEESPYNLQAINPGIYTLETLESNGCQGVVQGIAEVVISDLMVEETVNDISCNGGLGSISLEVSGGSAPYSFSWNNTPGNISEQPALGPGTYVVTVTDVNNCQVENSFVINESTPLEITTSVENVSCFGLNTGVVNIEVSGGNLPYLFSLGGTIFQEESTFEGLFAGSYFVEVKDVNGCQSSVEVIIEQPNLLEASVDFNGPLCFDGNNGYINIYPVGGVGEYAYSLNGIDFQNESQFSNLQAGTYTVFLKDGEQCLHEQIIHLPIQEEMEIELIASPPLCVDESTGQIEIMLSGGSTPFNYSINNGAFQTEPFFSNLPSGTYTVEVVDDNNCSASVEVILDVSWIDNPQILGNNQMCAEDCQSLSVDGDFENYYWNNGAEGNEIEICEGGHYDVTVVDENGCLAFADILVEEVEIPEVQITGDSILCDEEVITLALDGNYAEVLWLNGSNEPSIEVENPGTYSVQVFNEAGCQSQASFNVFQNDIDPVIISGANSICEGGSTLLNLITPFQSIFWSNGSIATGIQISTPGWYNVQVMDENGCESTDSIEVIVADFLSPIITGNHGICPGDTVVLAVSAGFLNYQWSNAETGNSIMINQPGIYSVTVDDGNNCSGEAAINVESFVPAAVEISGVPYFCSENFTTLLANQPFEQYLWSNGSINAYLEVDVPGEYTLSAIDSNGCESLASIFVDALMPSYGNVEQWICVGDSYAFNGQLIWEEGQYFDTLSASNINGCDSIVVLNLSFIPPTYDTLSITIEEGSFVLLGDQTYSIPGVYFDTAASFQTSCDSITVLNLDVVEELVFYDTLNFIICQQEELIFNEHVYQSQGVFSDTIFGNALNEPDSIFILNIEIRETKYDTLHVLLCNGDSIFLEDFWQKETGNYVDTFLTVYGCDSIIVTELSFSNLYAEILQIEQLYCHNDSAAVLEVSISEGISPFSLIWSTGTTTAVIDNLSSGIYSVTVTDALGCLVSTTFNIENPLPIIAETGVDLICEVLDSATLYVDSIFGGLEPYLFALEDGFFYQESSFKVPADTRQSLIIEDANGCRIMISAIEIGGVSDFDLHLKNNRILLGDSILINAVPNFDPEVIEWAYSPFLSCHHCMSPFVFPEYTTTFFVKMQSKEGCWIEKNITIFVDQNIDLFIPTVFSPNGDGVNDHFTIFSGKQIEFIKRLDIYNRWGALIFRKEDFVPNDESIGWDGFFKGKPMNAGMYVYVVELETIKGTRKREKGEILLIR